MFILHMPIQQTSIEQMTFEQKAQHQKVTVFVSGGVAAQRAQPVQRALLGHRPPPYQILEEKNPIITARM